LIARKYAEARKLAGVESWRGSALQLRAMSADPNRIDLDIGRNLVIATFFGAPDDATYERYLARLALNLREVIRAGTKTTLVLDTTHAPIPASAKCRQMQAEWLRAHNEELRLCCVGTAFVFQSTLIRGAVTAVLWLQSLPYEYTLVATRYEAQAWCIKQLALAGVSLGQQPLPAP
jgi:hypothetical protein